MSRPTIPERREEMISKLKKAGPDGIELETFINELTYSWGYGRTIVKKNVLELAKIKKATIYESRIYHSMFIPSKTYKKLEVRG